MADETGGGYLISGCADLLQGRLEGESTGIYKATQIDQYLDFSSHHPINHYLGVISILYDHCDNIVTEEEDATKEIALVNFALNARGIPSWSFKRVSE